MPIGGGGGGSGGGTQTTETTVHNELDPAAVALQQQALQMQQQYLDRIWNSISGPGPYYYPGELVAPLAPQSLMANAMTTQAFTDPMTYSSTPLANLSAQYAQSPGVAQAVGNANQLSAFLMSPQALDPRSNPFTAAAADAANRQTISQLTNQVLPSIRSDAVSAGQFGGSRQGISEGIAVTGAAQAISDTNASFFFDQYNKNLNAALQAQALLPSTLTAPQAVLGAAIDARGVANQQLLQGFAALDSAGLQLQQQAQRMIDAEVTRYMFNNTIGLQELQIYAGVGGVLTNPASYGSGSTQTSTTTGPAPYTSPLLGALGGAAAGASLGFGLPGAIIGGLLGLFAS